MPYSTKRPIQSRSKDQIPTPPSHGRTRSTVPTPILTDFSGVFLTNKREVLKTLYPGCIVRACVQNHVKGSMEALYFEIVRIKDGTVWGKTKDWCRWEDAVDLEENRVFAFPLRDVMEVPITFQPKALQRKLEKHVHPKRMGRAFTGVEF